MSKEKSGASEWGASAPTTSGGQQGRRLGATAQFWGRWLGVLPAAIFSVIAISFPVHWVVLMITSGSSDDGSLGIKDLPPETVERLAVAFFGPLAYVVVGAKVAPTYKLQTAVVLVILLAIVLSASATYVASNGDLDYSGWGWLEFVAVVTLWVGGVVAGVYQVYEDGRQ